MSITVHCPYGHAIKVDDTAPRDVACPRCGTVFAIGAALDSDPLYLPAGMAARSEGRESRDDEEEEDRPKKRKPRAEDEDDRSRRRKPRREEEDEFEEEEEDEPVEAVRLTRRQRKMAMVRLGILFHILKLWTYLAAMLFGFITMPLVLFIAAFGSGWIAVILYQITFNLSMTLAPIFGTIGSIMCAFVPPRSEARGSIIVSIIFDLLAPVFGVFQLVMFFFVMSSDDARLGRLMEYMFYARLACTLVAWWLFQLYLRKVSFYMHESLLASESLNVIVHFLIATVIGPTLVIVTVIITLVFIFPCIGAILFLITLGWLIYFSITFPIRQFRLLFLIRNKIYLKYIKPPD